MKKTCEQCINYRSGKCTIMKVRTDAKKNRPNCKHFGTTPRVERNSCNSNCYLDAITLMSLRRFGG